MNYEPFAKLKTLSRPILITGHTGFKGTWLTALLEYLNIPTVGYALEAEEGSLYKRIGHTFDSPNETGDIRDIESLRRVFEKYSPSAVIHLAAQPLVFESYRTPLATFETNVMGTANILEVVRESKSIKSVVVSTTDKVYENLETGKPFIESDPLKGKDPYSASKVGTESVVSAWQQMYKLENGPSLFSVRAGNVIGGGDFASNRIIPDVIRAISNGEIPEIRNPNSVRPWQHVLDPLFGYLKVLELGLSERNFDAFNFGPSEHGLRVEDLVKRVLTEWGLQCYKFVENATDSPRESLLLNLNSLKAQNILHWKPIWSQEEAISKTSLWWKKVINQGESAEMATIKDIETYLDLAR